MIDIPPLFPFTKLTLGDDEVPLWVGYNPTFHRFVHYGLLISNRALYVCSNAYIFARWRRYPLRDIEDVTFGPGRRPTFCFRVGNENICFRTPGDTYREEIEVDRRILTEAVRFLRSRLQGNPRPGLGLASEN